MHPLIPLTLAALGALSSLSSPARADIGPPPSCAEGTHREYLYGNHCVKDGFHLEKKEGGGFEEVPDGPPTPSPATPEPTPEPTPADPNAGAIPEAAPAEPVSAEPASVGSAPAATEARCATSPGGAGWLMALVALALAARRKASNNQT